MTNTESNWHFFVAKNSVALESLTELRTICQFQIPENQSLDNCNLSVIRELDRNTWRLLNLIGTLILYTNSHNLSFWNPWKLVHLNRLQKIAQSFNFNFLEVSAVWNCDQNVIWKLDEVFMTNTESNWHVFVAKNSVTQNFAQSINLKFLEIGH